MVRTALLLLLAFFTSPLTAAPRVALQIFDVGALSTWTTLTAEETTPYLAEGLRSDFRFGARSTAGSYAFVTQIDNTLDRDALGPEDIQGLFSVDTYQDLEPSGFTSEVVTVGEKHNLSALVVSFRTTKLGYVVSAPPGPVLVKTVFLPLVLRDASTRQYLNWIYVANFRGSTAQQGDLQAFDRLWQQAKLGDPGLSQVELDRFNALRPEIATVEPVSTLPLAPLPEPQGAAPGAPASEPLAQALVGALTPGSKVLAPGPLRRFTSEYPDTALAKVFQSLAQAQLSVLQEAIWQQAWQASPSAQKALLAALFLVQSISVEDERLVARVSQDAAMAGISAGKLDCEQLGFLLDLLLPQRNHRFLARPAVRQFFALAPDRGCGDLVQLMHAREIDLVQLHEVAREKHPGTWELKSTFPSGRLPTLAQQEGNLMLVQFPVGRKDRAIDVRGVTSLLDLIAALARQGASS